jgi:glucose/arabinose dehydrogenase
MNFIYKSKLLSAAVIISAMMFATKGHADGHTPKIKAQLVLKGLENPWDTAFLNDGTMFFTEKCKGLSVKTKSGVKHLLKCW